MMYDADDDVHVFFSCSEPTQKAGRMDSSRPTSPDLNMRKWKTHGPIVFVFFVNQSRQILPTFHLLFANIPKMIEVNTFVIQICSCCPLFFFVAPLEQRCSSILLQKK